MNGHTFHPAYRNNATGELWDPKTGDVLYPHTTSAAWGRFKRTLKRQLLWLAILLFVSLPLLIRR